MSNQGRLEIVYSKAWGTVCDDDFDDIDASVVCYSLGYGFVLVCCNNCQNKRTYAETSASLFMR